MLPVSAWILQQPLHDLLGGQAFGNVMRMLNDRLFDHGVDDLAQAGLSGNLYSPNLSSSRAFSARTPAMNR